MFECCIYLFPSISSQKLLTSEISLSPVLSPLTTFISLYRVLFGFFICGHLSFDLTKVAAGKGLVSGHIQFQMKDNKQVISALTSMVSSLFTCDSALSPPLDLPFSRADGRIF